MGTNHLVARRARSRLEHAKAQNEILARAAKELSTGMPLQEAVGVYKWAKRLETCGAHAVIRQCERHADHTTVNPRCCRVPLCMTYQRERSSRWVQRGMALLELLPQGVETKHGEYAWRMITISPRNLPTVQENIDDLVKLRAKTMRFLRRRHGCVDPRDPNGKKVIHGFSRLEVSPNGHFHLHMAVYCRWVQLEDRPEKPKGREKKWHKKGFRTWVAEQTDYRCTRGLCVERIGDSKKCRDKRQFMHKKITADWRAGKITKATARKLWDRWTPEAMFRRGFKESLKYLCSPIGGKDAKSRNRPVDDQGRVLYSDDFAACGPGEIGGVPLPGHEPTEAQLQSARAVVKLFSAMYRRHQIETYGMAKRSLRGEVGEFEPGVAITKVEHECPYCGGGLNVIFRGQFDNLASNKKGDPWRQRAESGTYRWQQTKWHPEQLSRRRSDASPTTKKPAVYAPSCATAAS